MSAENTDDKQRAVDSYYRSKIFAYANCIDYGETICDKRRTQREVTRWLLEVQEGVIKTNEKAKVSALWDSVNRDLRVAMTSLENELTLIDISISCQKSQERKGL